MTVAHPARVYDFWLGGKDHFAADREAGEQAVRAYPDLVNAVQANRAFLVRTVRYLAGEAGIRQFLDIGTGIPAANNTHEVAQATAPDAKVVYTDNDPMVLAHSLSLLRGSPNGVIAYLDADLRDPERILDQAAGTLDFGQPVAIMLVAVLQYLSDSDDPWDVVARLLRAVPEGSYLVVSHPASDINADQVAESMREYNDRAPEQATPRTRDAVSRFFAGLDPLEPGLVPIPRWRPDSAPGPDSDSIAMWGAVGRKTPS